MGLCRLLEGLLFLCSSFSGAGTGREQTSARSWPIPGDGKPTMPCADRDLPQADVARQVRRGAEVAGKIPAIPCRDGKSIAECSVRLDSRGRTGGTAFSYEALTTGGPYNEILATEAGDQSLYFKSMGMTWGSGHDKHPSQEGTAEFPCELFNRQAQS